MDIETNDQNTVAGLVRKSNRILASISTHKFPFDFFPNTIYTKEELIAKLEELSTTEIVT